MILDSSSILAVLFRENEAPALIDAIQAASIVGVGAPTLAETGIVLGARLGFEQLALLHRFQQLFSVNVLAFQTHHWNEAVEAYRRFGKGRHRASLNFADCLSYAAARVAGLPLLCVGDDFPLTDLPLVSWQVSPP